jgi:hypothetical protein
MTIRWKDQQPPRWNEGGREVFKADRAWDDAHPGRALIWFGRCRSGRRWFWTARRLFDDPESLYGWVNTEDEALIAARAAVERLAAGQDAVAGLTQGLATDQLKEVNRAKRAARLTARPSSAKDSRAVEYLFADGTRYDDWGKTHCPIYAFPIVKKTAKRIYYKHKNLEWLSEIDAPDISESNMGDFTFDDHDIGFVNRQELEAKGEVYNHGRHWSADDFHLLAKPPVRYEPEPETPNLVELKMAMAAAHPDRGGSNSAFIEARKRYVEARRRLKEVA